MFLRWQSRAAQETLRFHGIKRHGNRPDVHWRAVLVTAVRVAGKPRQRVVYLAGIRESAIILRKEDELDRFWHKVESRVPPEHRRRIAAAIAAKVPRPRERG